MLHTQSSAVAIFSHSDNDSRSSISQIEGQILDKIILHASCRAADSWTFPMCEKTVKLPGTGFTNFCKHIYLHHKDDITPRMYSSHQNRLMPLSASNHLDKKRRVQAWMDGVVVFLLPLNFCENLFIRKHFKYSSICWNSLLSYMHSICRTVEERITLPLHCLIALQYYFDGWSSRFTHSIAEFATYFAKNDIVYDKVLLSLSPMKN